MNLTSTPILGAAMDDGIIYLQAAVNCSKLSATGQFTAVYYSLHPAIAALFLCTYRESLVMETSGLQERRN